MEDRNGLIVQAQVTQADGRAERKAALEMIHRHSPGLTRRLALGADKGYDSADFVTDLRQACVTPHVARKSRHEKRRSPRGFVIIRDETRNQAHNWHGARCGIMLTRKCDPVGCACRKPHRTGVKHQLDS